MSVIKDWSEERSAHTAWQEAEMRQEGDSGYVS